MIAALRIGELSLRRGERVLFRDFTLAVAAGEVVALVGDNGAGKTSLLRAVAGFLRPLAGAIAFEGAGGAALPADDACRADCHLIGHQDGLKSGRTAWDELKFQVACTGGSLASAEAALAICVRLNWPR